LFSKLRPFLLAMLTCGVLLCLGALGYIGWQVYRMVDSVYPVPDPADLPPYVSSARPNLPIENIHYSRSVWPDGIPATPIPGQPQIIRHPNPMEGITFDPALAGNAGCSVKPGFPGMNLVNYACGADSPLAGFGCAGLILPIGVDFGLQPDYPLIAECAGMGIPAMYHDFTNGVAYIFRVGGGYQYVSQPAELQTLFAPVQDENEALSIAILTTGLQPKYDFPRFRVLYLQEIVEATRVRRTPDGFLVYLYHQPGNACEGMKIVSEVELLVQTDGSVVWNSAVPVYAYAESICH
jgi:hypothetical protein